MTQHTDSGRTAYEQAVQAHYSRGGLLERIVEGLRATGKDPAQLLPEDLSPVDEFHTRGRTATRELAEVGGIAAGERVLDAGSGLGGPARFLAGECGCDVTGVDLVPEFCAVATELSRLTGLAERTRFRQGSALALPTAPGSFDVVWTLQAQMNIADKRGFYGELFRALRPGGRLVFQDILLGNGEALELPVPWASRPEQSHLIAPDALLALLEELGFRKGVWRDVSAATLAHRKAHPRPAGADEAPLGIHLVMGPDCPTKQANSGRNLDHGRIAFYQGVFHKPV